MFSNHPNNINNQFQMNNQLPINYSNPSMMQATNHFSDMVIKPSEESSSSKKKTIHYIIDSRDRDTSVYPDPNKYTYAIHDEFKDITSVE